MATFEIFYTRLFQCKCNICDVIDPGENGVEYHMKKEKFLLVPCYGLGKGFSETLVYTSRTQCRRATGYSVAVAP